MFSQITDSLFMVRPLHFKKNEQTAVNNYFQHSDPSLSVLESQEKAQNEFDCLVALLREKLIRVVVFEDVESAETPDSIFPNNWITMHDDGVVILYPMFAPNRRKERRQEVIDTLNEDFYVRHVHDFVHWESKGLFLEGTGSLILDRPHKIAYAALSSRTCPEVLEDFTAQTGYNIVSFRANQTVNGQRLPIYHTNVMMALGERFAVVCLDAIDDQAERENLLLSLGNTHKEVIDISEEQVNGFAGNILQVRNTLGQPFIIMSSAAHKVYTKEQKDVLEKYGEILHSPIPTIERLGGGGVRCMMAEVFLPVPTLLDHDK